MISGGTCRMKKMGDIYADIKQVNKNRGKVEGQADCVNKGYMIGSWP